MKTKISIASTILILTVAVGNIFEPRILSSSVSINLSNIESLSDCEVKNHKGEIIVHCKGESGVCWEKEIGNGYLFCPGTEVN